MFSKLKFSSTKVHQMFCATVPVDENLAFQKQECKLKLFYCFFYLLNCFKNCEITGLRKDFIYK